MLNCARLSFLCCGTVVILDLKTSTVIFDAGNNLFALMRDLDAFESGSLPCLWTSVNGYGLTCGILCDEERIWIEYKNMDFY